MKIDEFLKTYGKIPMQSIAVLSEEWKRRQKIDDFLGTTVAGGYLLGDLLVGNGLNDKILPSQVTDAFKNLMSEKADSPSEVRTLLLDKIAKGDSSIDGLINKIQGQLGEDQFKRAVGSIADLAKSGSQEGWDVRINHAEGPQFVQVKVFDDVEGVIAKMKEVNEKLVAKSIFENGTVGPAVKEIDFAVNSDIYEDLKLRAKELGLENAILDIGATREELRASLEHAKDVASTSPLEGFFGELLGATASVAVIHAATQGFLVWKHAKSVEEAITDVAFSTAISSGGIAAGLLVETVLRAVPGVGILAFGAGISARAVLKRVASRRFLVDRLADGNQTLEATIRHYDQTNKLLIPKFAKAS